MSLYGFSRKDIAKSLSGFAKKNLIAGYPTDDVLQHGLGEFYKGGQLATDMELYAFISPEEIPAAVPTVDAGGSVKMEASVSPQRCKIYKPYPRSRQGDVADNQEVDVEVIQTGEGAAGGNSYGDAAYYVYNTFPKPIPKDTISFCAVFGGVLFVVDRPQQQRVRFRLKTDFNDTGRAIAYVLDQFGNEGLEYNEEIYVHDPRKLFAHAVGADSFTTIQGQNPNIYDMLHAGGSVGYAVMTYEIKNEYFDCEDDCDTGSQCYPRWEVEQCTQSVNQMRVFIDDYDAMPRGQNSSEQKSLRVYPDLSFSSQWPFVDYPRNLTVQPQPEGQPTEYRILCHNPHRFSARTGYAIIERVDYPQRLQNADNRCVPYVGGLSTINNEWHIVDVENPIARYICVSWQESQQKWTYDDVYFEGENPAPYFDNDGENIEGSIKTLPCFTIDCLKNGSPGFAFFDPNMQEYYVFSTESALYGKAVDYEVVGQKQGTALPLVQYGAECTLNYRVRKHIKVFGDNESCPTTLDVRSTNPAFEEVEVLTAVHRPDDPEYPACPSDSLTFQKETVYVCKSDAEEPTSVNICCPPCGCCVIDGTPTPGVTEEYCNEQGGTFYEGEDCPEVTCCEPVEGYDPEVSNANFQFGFTTIGVLVPNSSGFSASGPCGVTLTFDIEWTNLTSCAFGFSEVTTATAVLMQGEYCCYWEVTLTQPTNACFDPPSWPGNAVKFPYCEGEANSNCDNSIGICDEGCDNGGFNAYPSFQVINLGGCLG